jgi:DNA-binding transcriptional ArsR family regulator
MLPRNLDHYPPEMQFIARLNQATSHPCRAMLVQILFLKGETGFSELKSIINVPKSTLSRHIKYLVTKGFLEFRIDGLYYYYSLVNIPDGYLSYVMEPGPCDAILEETNHEEIKIPVFETLSVENQLTVRYWIRTIKLNFEKANKFYNVDINKFRTKTLIKFREFMKAS